MLPRRHAVRRRGARMFERLDVRECTRDKKRARTFVEGIVVRGINRKANIGGRHALIASAALALLSTTPAFAYDGWFFAPQRPIMIEPDPRAFAVARHSRRHQMTRKLSAEKRVSEKLPPGPLHIVISIKKQQLTLY